MFIYVLFYCVFGWLEFVFVYMLLLCNVDKFKIFKCKNFISVEWYQNQGFFFEVMFNFLVMMGWMYLDGQEIFDFVEFEWVFCFEDVMFGGLVFDFVKLCWYNGKYLCEVLSEDDVVW